jgi:hypothetical protein
MLVLAEESKPRTAQDFDDLVCAEIPDPAGCAADQRMHNIVESFMMHGPCGTLNPACVCMKDGSCSKHYPRGFQDFTTCEGGIYPVYRRRDNGCTVTKSFYKT